MQPDKYLDSALQRPYWHPHLIKLAGLGQTETGFFCTFNLASGSFLPPSRVKIKSTANESSMPGSTVFSMPTQLEHENQKHNWPSALRKGRRKARFTLEWSAAWNSSANCLSNWPPAKQKSADPCRQQGERVRGGITSSKGQEVITSSKGKKQENMKEEARSKKQLQATSGKKQETRSQEATSGWKTGQRSHYKQQGQEGRKQERRSKKQEAITGNKRQEARNKKPGSNKRLEDRSEKQETTSQEATSGWKTGQRSKKQEARKQQAAGRQVRELVFLSIQKATLGRRLEDRSEKQETRSQEATSGWKTGQRASFLVDSESNVRQAAGRQLRELVFL